jgi:hypothetical protein
MPGFVTFPSRIRSAVLAAMAASCAWPALAETGFSPTGPSLNFSGAPGLIDMPSGEALADEHLSFSTTAFGPISRTTISFQAAPWLSGSLRTTTTRNWNDLVCPPDCSGDNGLESYFDRSVDLRFHLLRESQYLPSVTIGLMDIIGPGVQSGEYIAATKHLSERLAVTAGLGWGRLATEGALGAPFGPRPAPAGDGALALDQIFTGQVAPFAGIEWRIDDRWTAKAEYSSDAYAEEAGNRGAFDVSSPFNFGIEYQHSAMLRFGAAFMYGSQLGLSAQVILDPGKRPSGAIGGTGPTPVKPRTAYAADPEAWSSEWVTQAGAQPILIENLAKFLERSGIKVEALSYTASTAQVRFRNLSLDAEAQAVGRVARAMTHLMPASVEVFEIVPMVDGVPASKVVLQRSDIEALEFTGNNAALIRQRAQIVDAGAPMANLARNPEIYPDFKWSLGPYARLRFLEPGLPVSGDVGLRLAARYEAAPGLVLQGSLTKIAFSNAAAASTSGTAGLPPVRSDADLYRANGDPAIETLTASWHGRVGPDLYGRVTLGYLEQMFGGVSTEVLWMPAGQRWALGVEANYVAQRDTDGGLGFDEYDYKALTGHVSGYVGLGAGYQAQLDLGQYLAGDLGGTLTLTRRFENGWKLGTYMTITDATGSEGIDRGINIEVPMSWLTGQPNRASRPVVLQPFVGNAGARLAVDDRLHDLLLDYSATGLDEQWGRFWK